MNKKGDVFKSSVGKAFINKLKRVSKNENEIHVKKPVPEQKVRYKQKEKVHDRVIIPIIAEGKKKSDIKYHIIFFMTFYLRQSDLIFQMEEKVLVQLLHLLFCW